MPHFAPAACRGDFPSLARSGRDGLVRAGMLMYNTDEEVDRLLEAVEDAARGKA